MSGLQTQSWLYHFLCNIIMCGCPERASNVTASGHAHSTSSGVNNSRRHKKAANQFWTREDLGSNSCCQSSSAAIPHLLSLPPGNSHALQHQDAAVEPLAAVWGLQPSHPFHTLWVQMAGRNRSVTEFSPIKSFYFDLCNVALKWSSSKHRDGLLREPCHGQPQRVGWQCYGSSLWKYSLFSTLNTMISVSL